MNSFIAIQLAVQVDPNNVPQIAMVSEKLGNVAAGLAAEGMNVNTSYMQIDMDETE